MQLWFRMALVYMVADKSRPTTWKRTLYAVEQPQDPSEYREDGIPYFSMWQTEEWKIFEKVFEMQRTSFDQGRLGHVRRKPTTLGHNFPQLHEALHEMRGPGVEKVDKWSDEKDLEKKMAESRRWAAWAPGLKLMLKMALEEWCAALESPGKIEIQALRADAKEMWKNHVRNDHYPARRDCKTCVRAAGRSKSHRKIQFPEAYTLSN